MLLQDEKLIKERSYYIVKANNLITKSRYSLTLQQQKILLYFIAQIKPEDDSNTVYELSINDFAKVCGYLENNGYYYQSIKSDIKKLSDTSSWIEVEKGKEVLFRWINTAEINQNDGTIRISFHQTVKPYLFALREQYTKYSLYNILGLSHKYAIRLYEFLSVMRYKGIFEISIDELKKHIDAESYKTFSNFNMRVLKPSIDDINDYTNLNIEYQLKKTGKAVTHIIFRYIEETSASSAITKILRDGKINPEKRKERKERIKELEKRRKKIREEEEAIETTGTITAQMTMDEFIQTLESQKEK